MVISLDEVSFVCATRQPIFYFLSLTVGLIVASGPLSATYVFDGPQDANGNTCDPSGGHCVLGDPLTYFMKSAALTGPILPGGTWALTIKTNYGVPLPGSNEVIPKFGYGNGFFAMCDFMIEWDNRSFGIVMNVHDGYVAGNLYEVGGFQYSGSVMGSQGVDSPRPSLPVLVGPGGTQIGTGVLSASANPTVDGFIKTLYQVNVVFTAPSDFLDSGKFTIHACSYACANGYVTGTREVQIPGPDTQSEVPEPATAILVLGGIACMTRLHSKHGS